MTGKIAYPRAVHPASVAAIDSRAPSESASAPPAAFEFMPSLCFIL